MNTTQYKPEHLKRWVLPRDYAGTHWDGYYVAPCGLSRTSDVFERSNWRSQWELLKAHRADVSEADESSPVEVTENHWAVGWVSWVAIHESNESALREADAIAERLENYPILDEDDFSREEDLEAQEIWRNCYRDKERLEYVRKHRSQFEFNSFSEMLSCIRGRYFSGYASDLIH